MNNYIESLKSVLCDPEGKCCIRGSDGDKEIVTTALKQAEINERVLQKIRDGDDWFEIDTCPKLHGVDYKLFDADDGKEVISWFGAGEWCHEGSYTHWKPLCGKKHLKMLMEKVK